MEYHSGHLFINIYRVTLMSHVQVLPVLWLNVSVTLVEGIHSGHVSINSESCHANITLSSVGLILKYTANGWISKS